MYKFICCWFLLILFSCSSDKTDVSKQQAQGPDIGTQTSQTVGSATVGSYSLEIVPVNATKTSRLYSVPHGFNPSEAKIEWFVNGEKVANPKTTEFDASTTKKRDKVQAKANIQGQEIVSNTVQIGNSPPEISKVKIMPEVFNPGDTLSVDASGTDIDGDEVALSYEWTKNGEPAGNSRQMQIPLKRGDKISVKITPFDGTDYGRAGILHREIVNLPPTISDNRKYLFDGKRYTHQINATDPDGDSLTYSLKKSPSGMRINANGLITWDVPSDFIGKASFTVAVADGHGGEATQELSLAIKPEQKK
jgi:translation initiation factor IF-1